MMVVWQLRWKCDCRHQQNPLPCPDCVVLAGITKIRVCLATYYREKCELREDRVCYSGRNSGSPLWDDVGSFKKELIRLWNSILNALGQPSAHLSNIGLTASKQAKHTINRLYKKVYIQRLVAPYDMHNNKRWLNYNPNVTGNEIYSLWI